MSRAFRIAVVLIALRAATAASFPDNTGWADILRTRVTGSHLVDYRAIRDRNRAALDKYAEQLASPWPAMSADARKAALINAYNALTIRWIVENYPVESIWRTKKPFTEVRQTVNGKRVSLDDIEGELRKMDARVHAALVCAARSCPPLRREPYSADHVNEQLDSNFREWLQIPDRNHFDPSRRVAAISKIFDWYGQDFASMGGVRQVLARYAPEVAAAMLRDSKDVKIEYQPYRWGLNDTSELGSRYSALNFYVDRVKN